jgi:hypothetical protein
MRDLRNRVAKLEGTDQSATYVWVDADLSEGEQLQRLDEVRRERGLPESVKLVLMRWQSNKDEQEKTK